MNQENEIAPSLTDTQVRSISDRKRAANRQNARHSTGPKTEAGKGRSRWNAIKHALLLKAPANHWPYITDGAGPFEEPVEALIVHFAPVGPIEAMLVEQIAGLLETAPFSTGRKCWHSTSPYRRMRSRTSTKRSFESRRRSGYAGDL